MKEKKDIIEIIKTLCIDSTKKNGELTFKKELKEINRSMFYFFKNNNLKEHVFFADCYVNDMLSSEEIVAFFYLMRENKIKNLGINKNFFIEIDSKNKTKVSDLINESLKEVEDKVEKMIRSMDEDRKLFLNKHIRQFDIFISSYLRSGIENEKADEYLLKYISNENSKTMIPSVLNELNYKTETFVLRSRKFLNALHPKYKYLLANKRTLEVLYSYNEIPFKTLMEVTNRDDFFSSRKEDVFMEVFILNLSEFALLALDVCPDLFEGFKARFDRKKMNFSRNRIIDEYFQSCGHKEEFLFEFISFFVKENRKEVEVEIKDFYKMKKGLPFASFNKKKFQLKYKKIVKLIPLIKDIKFYDLSYSGELRNRERDPSVVEKIDVLNISKSDVKYFKSRGVDTGQLISFINNEMKLKIKEFSDKDSLYISFNDDEYNLIELMLSC